MNGTIQSSSPSILTIRHATVDDMPTIMTLIDLKADFDGCPEAVQATPEQLIQDLFGSKPLVSILLAEVAGTIVGFASYHRIYSTFLSKPGLWLDDLFLIANYRNQGVGRALVRHLCSIAEATGCGRIDWTVATHNHRGIRFYESLGAEIMQQVRMCRLDERAIAHLSQSSPPTHGWSLD